MPVEANAPVTERPGGERVARETPLALEQVPIVRVLNAGVALVDPPARAVPSGFAGDALRAAATLGAELKDLVLPKDKAGRTVVNAVSVLRVLRTYQARPVGDSAEDRIPRAEIDVASGLVHLDGAPWLRPDDKVPAADVARDARLIVDYIGSFLKFFGNSAGAVEVYWAFLVWPYATPLAPHLRCSTDVTRDKFTTHVPDLVRTDQDMTGGYAPVDAAIPENRSVTERLAGERKRRSVPPCIAPICSGLSPECAPCVRKSTPTWRGSPIYWRVRPTGVLGEALGELPDWARLLSFGDYFGIRHPRFRDQLEAMLADAEDRVTVNRRSGELTIGFGGDTNQAAQFARSVPDFVLKGRFADVVRLDLTALEQEMGFAVGRTRAWWQKLLRR